jgi:hypothetical protein
MSSKYPGGIISKTAPTPSGPYADSTAPGIWTLEQQAAYAKQGNWPTAGNVNPNLFIENLFSTYLYTGTGAALTITNGIDLSTNGGMVWTKSRSNAYNNALVDTARGGSSVLVSNNTDAASTSAARLSFSSTGYNILSTAGTLWNDNAATYVSWTFREQPKFFDIVTYTGNGTQGRSVSHNLGSAPGFMIVKRTDGVDNWRTYHRSLGGTKFMSLDTDAAAGTANTLWNDADPTSTVFYLGNDNSVNASGGTYVAYLFAHDAGGFGLTGTENVISCGSFTAPVATTFNISLGYEPQFLLVKKSSGFGDWYLIDVMRGFNSFANAGPQNKILKPNSSGSEGNEEYYRPTATGIQGWHLASADYIYIAIRRGPMAVPTSGTSVFSPNSTSATTGTQITTGFPVDLQMFYYPIGTNSSNTTFQDRLRGVSSNSTDQYVTLVSSSTGAEGAVSGQSSLFWNNTGFQIPSYANGTSQLYLNFRRAPGFFDVVCYTGTGSARTVTHNLTVAPELLIIKSRSQSGIDWSVWSKSGTQRNDYKASLNTAGDYGSTGGDLLWGTPGSSAPSMTSTTFSLGDYIGVNNSGSTYVAYLFATCAGVSKVGSYTGTGTTLQIDCGFTGGARFVLIKRTDSTGAWYVWDSARGIVAGNDPYLLLNSTAAEVTGTDYVDTYSAGFEISSTAPAAINASGGTFIFLAIA